MSSVPQHLDATVIDRSAAERFRTAFNKVHFPFRHRLERHELFSVPRLVELASQIVASRTMRHYVGLSAVRDSPARKFDQLDRLANLPERLQRVADSDAWLRMSFAQEYHAGYRAIHDQILDDAAEYSGFPLRPQIGWSSMTIFVSSPHVVTPYHIDHESNLLFQIEGEKEVWLFDPADRRVLSEEEIERYYVGNLQAAEYRPAVQAAGTLYRLTPGHAVHNPPLGPHWVRNGGAVSVSLSFNFGLRNLEPPARVYQMNHYLRRLGRRPAPPGLSGSRDWLKALPMRVGGVWRPRYLEELLQPGPRRLVRKLSNIGWVFPRK
jgi:cupin-like protein